MAGSDDTKPTPPVFVEEFLRTVLRSGLMTRAQILETIEPLSSFQRQDAVTIADHLVRRGKLSRFQARKLLKGVSRGLILGDYQILALIGRGGMGSVYLARDRRTSHLVALKVLPPHKAKAKQRLVTRFQREMELSPLVRHPHLCRTFEVGQIRGVHYLAMEFIPGQTLSKLISTSKPFEQGRAARLMAEVASGLEHAHQQGLVHRDLKPSNIMITPHDHAKVLDLGLAMMMGEELEDPTMAGGKGYVVGTFDYIAPEQTTDPDNVDGRADIYALGCTLYQTLTGQPPFPGGTTLEKIKRHRKEEPLPILQLRPDLQPLFAALIHKMMAKDPRQRFRSAREVEEKLWFWADHAPLQPLDTEADAEFVEAIDALKQGEPGSTASSIELDLPGDSVTLSLLPVDQKPWSTLSPFLRLMVFLITLTLLALLLWWLLKSDSRSNNPPLEEPISQTRTSFSEKTN